MSSDKQDPPVEPGVDPKTADDFLQRGWTLHVQGDYTRAEADFRKALDMNADAPEATYALGMSLKIQGKQKESVEYFQKTIELVEAGHLNDDPGRGTMLRHMSESHIVLMESGLDMEHQK